MDLIFVYFLSINIIVMLTKFAHIQFRLTAAKITRIYFLSKESQNAFIITHSAMRNGLICYNNNMQIYKFVMHV